MSSVPLQDTYLKLPMMSDIFTTPRPKVTFEYLRKKSIRKNSKDVRRGRDDVNADKQREHQGSNSNEDVPSINFGGPNTYDIMSNNRSSAADVQGPDLEFPDEESDDTVEAPAIFAPEDCRACKRYDLDDSTRPADTKRGVPSQYWHCNVGGDVSER